MVEFSLFVHKEAGSNHGSSQSFCIFHDFLHIHQWAHKLQKGDNPCHRLKIGRVMIITKNDVEITLCLT